MVSAISAALAIAAARAPTPDAALALELGAVFLSESLAAGALDIGPVLVPAVRLTGRVAMGPGCELSGHLRYLEYTLVDRVAPDSRHHRDDFSFGAQATYELPIVRVRPWVGAGYDVRFVSVASNVAPPLSQPVLFSPAQLYHGPRLAAGWRGPLRPGWRLDLEGGFRPYLFAAGDLAVSSLAPLYGYDAAAGLTWSSGAAWSVRAGYAFDSTGGYYNDFKHAAHGPSLTGGWRF